MLLFLLKCLNKKIQFFKISKIISNNCIFSRKKSGPTTAATPLLGSLSPKAQPICLIKKSEQSSQGSHIYLISWHLPTSCTRWSSLLPMEAQSTIQPLSFQNRTELFIVFTLTKLTWLFFWNMTSKRDFSFASLLEIQCMEQLKDHISSVLFMHFPCSIEVQETLHKFSHFRVWWK